MQRQMCKIYIVCTWAVLVKEAVLGPEGFRFDG